MHTPRAGTCACVLQPARQPHARHARGEEGACAQHARTCSLLRAAQARTPTHACTRRPQRASQPPPRARRHSTSEPRAAHTRSSGSTMTSSASSSSGACPLGRGAAHASKQPARGGRAAAPQRVALLPNSPPSLALCARRAPPATARPHRFCRGKDSLLDVCCGRGGDIQKWNEAGVRAVGGGRAPPPPPLPLPLPPLPLLLGGVIGAVCCFHVAAWAVARSSWPSRARGRCAPRVPAAQARARRGHLRPGGAGGAAAVRGAEAEAARQA